MIREDEADDDRVVCKIVTDPVEIIFLCFRPNGEILSYTLYKQNDRVSQYLFSPLFMIIKLSADGDDNDHSWQRETIHLQGFDAQVS